jgi:hypothetical protein
MGSGKMVGSRCICQDEVPTMVPAGRKWELKVAPESGTMRGRRPTTPKERRRDSFITADFGRR